MYNTIIFLYGTEWTMFLARFPVTTTISVSTWQ